MAAWSDEDLDRLGAAEEVLISTVRADGTLRRYVPIWIVRAGDDLYVRSWHGNEGAWFRHASRQGSGRIKLGGVEHDVRFEVPDNSVHPAIDAGYRSKYGRHGSAYVDPMV